MQEGREAREMQASVEKKEKEKRNVEWNTSSMHLYTASEAILPTCSRRCVVPLNLRSIRCLLTPGASWAPIFLSEPYISEPNLN